MGQILKSLRAPCRNRLRYDAHPIFALLFPCHILLPSLPLRFFPKEAPLINHIHKNLFEAPLLGNLGEVIIPIFLMGKLSL